MTSEEASTTYPILNALLAHRHALQHVAGLPKLVAFYNWLKTLSGRLTSKEFFETSTPDIIERYGNLHFSLQLTSKVVKTG